jgi:HSP20 family protein
MLSRWNDFDRTFSLLDELRRRMVPAFEEFDTAAWSSPSLFGGSELWPRVNLADTGSELRIEAEVPGLTEKDVTVSLHQGVVTLSGERRTPAPEGYVPRRQERPSLKFTRSFNLPYRVDADAATATVKDGILTVRVPKAAEAKPRQISVKGA